MVREDRENKSKCQSEGGGIKTRGNGKWERVQVLCCLAHVILCPLKFNLIPQRTSYSLTHGDFLKLNLKMALVLPLNKQFLIFNYAVVNWRAYHGSPENKNSAKNILSDYL